MVAVRIYVEGGGDAKARKTACRRGFSELFRKAGLEGALPRVIASGSRQTAYEDFCTAVAEGDGAVVLLLVDSEAPVASGSTPWEHLRVNEQWKRPRGTAEDQAHLMVQCMESWFLADRSALSTYFGEGWNENALPRRREIEEVPKKDVFVGLSRGSRHARKGRYEKGSHSFEILALIDPARLCEASPSADRLLKTLTRYVRGVSS